MTNNGTNSNTRAFQSVQDGTSRIEELMAQVYAALQYKGYNPVSQIVGYIMSGDPTYITSYADARYLISQVERAEILEVLLKHYISEVIEKK